MEKCICCHKNEVTWPRVCDECTDQEAQAELAMQYINDGTRALCEDPMDPDAEMFYSGGECKTCGMLYDGGIRCTYCGDADPWEQGHEEEEEIEY